MTDMISETGAERTTASTLFFIIIGRIKSNGMCKWVEDGKKMPLEDVINMTNRIVLGGVNGFFK